MQEQHVTAVVALEQDCRLSSRGESGYRKAIQDERSLLLVGLAEPAEVIALFSALMVVDELQIDNVAVAENYRRRGVGAMLLAEALRQAKLKGMNSAFLEVRAMNSAALRLYKNQGFFVTGRRKHYYQNPADDALMMTLNHCK
ncbi:MAG TPA: ribosomal protein S18-alanine N-acetyltransferase [Blastocatellia bacterium]|nr:ribosomal protein S18-alanine N-acetyltransferase [Blastocatellia bacterium]HNG28315.1 ribosomal protein S18-alanine N-acetyltransferase [Blastocatellia bacterium]